MHKGRKGDQQGPGKQPTGAHDFLVQRATSKGRRLKDHLVGDGHCEIYSAVDQLRQQGFNATLQSLRTDIAAFLTDKEYAWSHFSQDDTPNWALFVQQVGYTGPGGFFVNHTIFAAIACMYNCDLTVIQSMPDETHAFELEFPPKNWVTPKLLSEVAQCL